jgi:aminoglycoside phosphotransferase (APT) family kinase protein
MVPRPLLLVEHLGFVVLEDFRGDNVRDILPADNARVPLSLLGHWLARLHATRPLPGLSCPTPEHELEKVHRWAAQIAAVSTRTVARRVARVLEMMRSLMSESPHAPVMIHKDFYYGNALFDGQRVCVVDFDELSIGDPALDVGHFVAHLEAFAYRCVGRTGAFSEAARTFVNSYQERVPLTLDKRGLTFYKAYTFLKLAATEVTRRRAGWKSMTRALTGMACRELERAQA